MSKFRNIYNYCFKNNAIYADFPCSIINNSLKFKNFLSCPKLADITILLKKGKKFLKENYRPISILAALSKITLLQYMQMTKHHMLLPIT